MWNVEEKDDQVIPVPVRDGSIWYVRPAENIEVQVAGAEATRLIQGVVAAQESSEEVVSVLGEKYRHFNPDHPQLIIGAAEHLALIELAALCTDRWEGIGFGGEEVEHPSREQIAVVLKDARIARLVQLALESGVHKETSEKNGFSTSPNGGVETAVKPALDADTRGTLNA